MEACLSGIRHPTATPPACRGTLDTTYAGLSLRCAHTLSDQLRKFDRQFGGGRPEGARNEGSVGSSAQSARRPRRGGVGRLQNLATGRSRVLPAGGRERPELQPRSSTAWGLSPLGEPPRQRRGRGALAVSASIGLIAADRGGSTGLWQPVTSTAPSLERSDWIRRTDPLLRVSG